jgi:hypothetical protein
MNEFIKSHLKRIWWSFMFALFVVAVILIITGGKFIVDTEDKTPEETISEANKIWNNNGK